LYIVDISDPVLNQTANVISTGAFCLLLPGTTLVLSSLLAQKKFRNKGRKEGALAAMKALASEGLGKLIAKSAHRGTAMVSD